MPELSLRRSTWRQLSRIGCRIPATRVQAHAHRGFRVPPRPKTPSRLWLIRRSTGAAESVSTQVQDCQQPLASLLVEIVPPHHTPDRRLLHLGSPLRPQVVIKSRIAKHCLLADYLSDRLTLQEIICFSRIVLRIPFFWLEHRALVISPTSII